MRIRELPLHDQPAQRLLASGPAALSDAELLALVSGEQDLARCQATLCTNDGWGGILRDDVHTLAERLGTARRAAAVKAALEIGRRLLVAGVDTRPQIKSPSDVATLLLVEMGHLEQEHLRTVLLDTKNRVQQIATVYIGSVNSAQVRVGEVFRDAIRRNSAAMIVAHNHPSGDPTPSPEDILVTRQIVEAGKLLDIEVLDHLILGSVIRFSPRRVYWEERGQQEAKGAG